MVEFVNFPLNKNVTNNSYIFRLSWLSLKAKQSPVLLQPTWLSPSWCTALTTPGSRPGLWSSGPWPRPHRRRVWAAIAWCCEARSWWCWTSSSCRCRTSRTRMPDRDSRRTYWFERLKEKQKNNLLQQNKFFEFYVNVILAV